MVDDGGADRRLSLENRQRRRGFAALVQSHDDLGSDRPFRVLRDAKADDIQRDRRAHGKIRRGLDEPLEPARQTASALDALAEQIQAESLDREPGFERAKSAREIGAEIAGPYLAGRETARRARQIGRIRLECGEMLARIAHQHEAGVIGNLQPFMEVEGDAVGPLQTFEQGLERVGERGEGAEGAVDMKPDLLLARDIGQRIEIVDRARIHRPGRADDEERLQSGGAIGGDGVGEILDAHPAAFVGRDEPQVPGAEARELHRLTNAIVHVARGIGDERRLQRAKTVEPHILVLRCAVTGDQEPQKIRHGGAGDENPRGVVGKAEGLRHPSADLALDVERDVIASAAIGVEAGGEHLGHHASRTSRTLNPAHEHRVPVAHREGHDVALKFLSGTGELLALARLRAAKECTRLVARRTPYRPLAKVANIVDHRVERPMRLGSEGLPVLRIEVAGGVLFALAGVCHEAPPTGNPVD